MGRSKELSDFQRGTVVGCHLSKKSVREISALLDLPRSTVSNVILRWKREGITTAMPRCGRPHKLQEQHRQVLEKMALEKCLPSIKAITSEFQSASGTCVSFKTVRRELREMGFRGRVSTYKSKVGGKVKKRQEPVSQEVEKEQEPVSEEEEEYEEEEDDDDDDAAVDVSRLDLRVGHITALQPLEADGVYVAQVDVGETTLRTVVSELANEIPVDQMQNRMAVLLCNLKLTSTAGVEESQAVVMCASSPYKVEILDPPCGAVPGDRVTLQGFPGEPDKELTLQKIWDKIQADLRTDGQCVATYKGAAFEVVGKGVCKSQTMSNCEIK